MNIAQQHGRTLYGSIVNTIRPQYEDYHSTTGKVERVAWDIFHEYMHLSGEPSWTAYDENDPQSVMDRTEYFNTHSSKWRQDKLNEALMKFERKPRVVAND